MRKKPKTSELCVETAVKDFGKLTAVCLNAGLFGPCYPIANSTVEKWAKAFEVNVLSHLHTVSTYWVVETMQFEV